MAELRLAVKKEYFDQIKFGHKVLEYRLRNKYWYKRIADNSYDTIVITLGYPKKTDTDKILRFEYNGWTAMDIVHEHFGAEKVKVFAIDLSRPILAPSRRQEDE
jgi:ASC-1-like (ASCH) protein